MAQIDSCAIISFTYKKELILQAQLYTTTAGYTISTYKLPQRVYNKLSDDLINLAHDVCVNCYNNVFNCDDYSIAKAIMLSKCHSETLRLFPKATQQQADIVTRRIAHDVFGIQ